ncbi:hypothetical protein QOZ95_005624 [Paenibacillus brasilensis]|uniref:Uncharacterized protein n=1 Tax=Paenibacillus brasilensis TaxID=128574 RepID=A0ABU0L7U3_9BACL|nr:hypothetical protein [Paenibacillus brasilensis]
MLLVVLPDVYRHASIGTSAVGQLQEELRLMLLVVLPDVYRHASIGTSAVGQLQAITKSMLSLLLYYSEQCLFAVQAPSPKYSVLNLFLKG